MKGATIFIIIIIFSFSFLITSILYKTHETENNNCLKNIARGICNEKGMVFNNMWWEFGAKFSCKGDIHQLDFTRFEFTKEEVERCLG